MRVFLLIPLLMLVLIIGMPSSIAQSVPEWVKNTAGWWSTDAISETEFVNAIEFLVNVGIISVEGENKCVNDFLKYFDNKQKIVDVCDEHSLSIHEELIPYENKIGFNSEGFRGDEFSKEKSSDVYRIFIVGGSTILGAETSNETTIPAIVQKMFDKQNLELEIEVINAGISGGNTRSELELIKSKIVNYNPDLVIMYDGWNDLSADYPVMGIINKWGQVCALGYNEKFDLIITLQPIAGFGNKQLTNQEYINSLTGEDHNGYQLIQAKSTYQWLGKELQLLHSHAQTTFGEGFCETYDLRNIFDEVKGPIFWDQGHTLQAGNLIVAEKFFELAMKKIEPTYVHDGKFREIIADYNSIPTMTYLFDKIGISDKTFQNELKDTTKLKNDQGKFFELKNELGEISNSLVGKDLRNADLTNINLKGQNLTGANMSGQNLQDIDFSDAIIRNANLSYTNLEGKDFSGMDLRGIDFTGANLKDVNFSDAIISKTIQIVGDCGDENPAMGIIKNFICNSTVLENEEIRTNFTNADLTNAKFASSLIENQMIYFADFTNADLTNVDLYKVQLFGGDFTNAKLNGISGKQIFILENDFTNSEMNDFEISETWIQSTVFYDADMKNGNFDSITFIDVDFSGTDFQGTQFLSLNEIGDNNYSCKNSLICK